ncbi:MAG: E3 binding domain-containing protein [Haloplanus sp.]
MGYVVRMPKLGLEMEQGTLLEWAVERGEPVSEDELVAEIESEKSIGEVDAREDGVLRRTYLEADDAVPPGTPIGIVADADADIADLEAEAEAELSNGGADGDAGTATESEPESAEPTEPDPAESDADASTVKASPRARKRAEELGVDLTAVEGTGPQGSVTEDDVEVAAESDADDVETAESVTPTRSSPSTAARYRGETAVLDADAADALFDATTAAREAVETDASVTDVALLVASAALSAQPECNGTFENATHQVRETHHVAVSTDDGAVVVAGADDRSLSGIVAARTDSTENGSTPTFTLSNAADADGPGRIVNPPAVAALSFDPVGQRATPTADGVRLDRLVSLRLTYDARALDPSDARGYLDAFAEAAGRAPALVTESYL